jgi:two-component system, chemotaxis family, protein-glutamate methylesterase/glutaminase
MTANPTEAVVIGASAGALEALSVILPALPAGFRLPLIVVVHVPPDKRSMLAELFQAKCRIRVREAEDKEPINPGTVYFAPSDYHLLVETEKSLSLSSDEPVLFSRPSIDVLFESAADAYGSALIAIILTGANHDGAKGMKAVFEAGGVALVQNPDGAFASAMPEAAIEMCPGARVMSLDAIAAYLQEVGIRP